MQKKKIAQEILKIAKTMVSTMDKFTVIKPMRLKSEGATRNSLEIARLIQAAGYEVISTVYTWDKNIATWNLEVLFERYSDHHQASHIFKGFSFGYGGEGPHGMIEFGKIFGLPLDESKVFGENDEFNARVGESNSGPLSLFE